MPENVTSRTGMHNNDEADRLAKESVDPKVRIATHITHGETAHEGMAVPSHKEEITPEGPACVPHHPMCKWKQAANLTAVITNPCASGSRQPT